MQPVIWDIYEVDMYDPVNVFPAVTLETWRVN